MVVNSVSYTLNVSRNTTKKFENHTRTVTNFHKYGNIGIIDLICISLKINQVKVTIQLQHLM